MRGLLFGEDQSEERTGISVVDAASLRIRAPFLSYGRKDETIPIDSIITCSDEVLSGTPVFKNTRVPVKNLIDYLVLIGSLHFVIS